MLTYSDILDRLKQVDEISLLEVLDISSEELVDRFEDRIRERIDYLMEDLEDDS